MSVKEAKPKDKAYSLFDGGGLYLYVTANSKLWRMKYRFDGKEALLSFGKYPEISLQQARQKRDDAKKLIANGVDPSEYKKEEKAKAAERNAYTFEKVARAWHTAHLSGWQESTAKDAINRLEKDIFPEIGNIPIHEIIRKLIIGVLEKVEARGVYDTAKRLKTNIGRVFRYAVQREIITVNPRYAHSRLHNSVSRNIFVRLSP